MGYLKSKPDGSMGLTFLTGCEGTAPSCGPLIPGEVKPLALGLVVGKLSSGTAALHNYHDDKRTIAKPGRRMHDTFFTLKIFCSRIVYCSSLVI